MHSSQAVTLTIHTDGGSRGNPGPAALGVCVLQGETVVHEYFEYLGIGTNNEAEYQALLYSIRWAVEYVHTHPVSEIVWKLDSQLVVQQVSRNWKIKEVRLLSIAQNCWSALSELSVPYSLTYVPRAQNKCADALVNQSLDAQLM